MICSIKPQVAFFFTRKIACKNHVHPQYTVQHRYDRFRPHGSAIHGGHGHPSLGPMWGNYGLMTIPRCKNATDLASDPIRTWSEAMRSSSCAWWSRQVGPTNKIGRGFTWWATTLVTTGLSLFLLLSGVIAHDSWGEPLGLMLIWGYWEYKTNREKSTKNN